MRTQTDPLITFPVASYARYSTDRQDARSIDDQVRRCRAFATDRGYAVVAEYKDAAISGAHLERADMQRMLACAQQKSGAPWRAVLVDDLSRLSRDLGDTWRIIFEHLASVDVKVIDCTTGMASDGPGARLTFGAMALVNDTFLQLVRTETHRGLQGRALAGFWTGGRVYGYTAVEEENPPDLEHRRKRLVIDEVEASIVRRIFRLFIEGLSLKAIAHTLNSEGIRAPHDGGKGNKQGRGWPHTTIRAILTNERYLGRFSWNTSKWIRVPGKKQRRRVIRPKQEWVVSDCPELAIVDKTLWDGVAQRFERTRKSGRGRPSAAGKHVYLVSGLLRCGACGGSMTIISRVVKAGRTYPRFGCTAHSTRGSSICANNLTVSEWRASAAITSAIQKLVTDPEIIARFIAEFTRRLPAAIAAVGSTANSHEDQIRDAEKRIRNLTEALAKIGWSDALASQLKEEEGRLRQLKSARTVAASKNKTLALPSPAEVASYLGDLLATLGADSKAGQATLARHLAPVVLTPQGKGPDRHYRATGALNLSVCLRYLTAGGAGGQVAGKSGSGGALPDFPATWIPTEEILPRVQHYRVRGG